MKDLKQFIKTTIREFLNESSIGNIEYKITYSPPENIHVVAKIDGVIIGTLSIIDDSHKEYRQKGIYINLIKYFLLNNKYGVKSLYSSKEPEFDTEKRTSVADGFWKNVYTNQNKYGVNVDKIDNDYEISLK
jgi:hypothetical protein